jgi:hypothetical protein
MTREFSHAFYPDMDGDYYGKKVVTLSCRVTNGKRFKTMSEEDREHLINIIETFQSQLEEFKKDILKTKEVQS